MNFAGNWLQVHPSSVSSNSLPTDLSSTCLGTAFHSQNVLMKSFTVFVTDFAELFWEKKFTWYSKKWIFRLIKYPTDFVLCQQFLQNIIIVRCFVIS